ncbi:uncharacterized protein LOC119796625 [Cyprinodon tularosa]|uniref:uncharacterized protein LOC119796625 n=1 Tax=Cyprinodon tularosa TaxID=77115 RepID=UPI0018E23CC0|nr:uncharacterized protein LOC119796625 [Cyprinodon tularosa]
MNMAPQRSGLSFLIFISFCLHVAAEGMDVIVGDGFTFPESCDPGESGELLAEKKSDPLKVASCEDGQWTVSAEYRDRVKISEKIVFTHTVFTDGGAVYTLKCSGKEKGELLQLKVVFAHEMQVKQGEKAVLPCYFETSGKTDLSAVWKKEGKPLCVKNCSHSSEDRLSVSGSWSTDGNLSLTIREVQPGDYGDYFCYNKDQPGMPAAVRLKEKKSDRKTTASPEHHQTQSCSEQIHPWKISTGILAGILLITLILLFLVCCLSGFEFRKLGELLKKKQLPPRYEVAAV